MVIIYSDLDIANDYRMNYLKECGDVEIIFKIDKHTHFRWL